MSTKVGSCFYIVFQLAQDGVDGLISWTSLKKNLLTWYIKSVKAGSQHFKLEEIGFKNYLELKGPPHGKVHFCSSLWGEKLSIRKQHTEYPD